MVVLRLCIDEISQRGGDVAGGVGRVGVDDIGSIIKGGEVEDCIAVGIDARILAFVAHFDEPADQLDVGVVLDGDNEARISAAGGIGESLVVNGERVFAMMMVFSEGVVFGEGLDIAHIERMR